MLYNARTEVDIGLTSLAKVIMIYYDKGNRQQYIYTWICC